MKRALIIDDEPLARKIIAKYCEDSGIEIIGECGDGFEAMKAIQSLHPDLLFLDIQMPKLNGFELLELLPNPPQVIFSTAHDEYAIRAFEVHAIDYLLKPYSKERFLQAVNKIGSDNPARVQELVMTSQKHAHEKERIVIKDGANIQVIPTVDVTYLEAYDDYVKIHTAQKTYIKKQTLTYFEETLDSAVFVRTHRSFMINIQFLTKIESYEKNAYLAILTTGDRVKVSRNSYSLLKERLAI